MLDSTATVEFGSSDVPLPSSSSYNEFIKGFIKGFISIGDFDLAISWFERMLAQPETPIQNSSGNSVTEEAALYTPLKATPQPYQVAWNELSGALANQGLVS